MVSKKIFDLMEANDWNQVTELFANTAWTSQDLEAKHGVRSNRAPLAAAPLAGMRQFRYSVK